MKGANKLAYDYIKTRILNGTYLPAQRLVEAQLSQEIGVSRNTIKKSLLLLQQDKLISLEGNKSATICSLSIEEVLDYYEIREALETIIAFHAAKHISSSDISKLKKLTERMERNIEAHKFEEYSIGNKEFHKIIYDASGKQAAVNMIAGIRNQLNRYMIRTMLVPGRANESMQEHRDILQAMDQHNSEMAQKKMGLHIRNVAETINKYHGLLFS